LDKKEKKWMKRGTKRIMRNRINLYHRINYQQNSTNYLKLLSTKFFYIILLTF